MNFQLTFDVGDTVCAFEIQVLLDDGTGTYALHDLSVMNQINSVATNTLITAASGATTKTINLTVLTSDLMIDSDGTIICPV